jgi:hypothetical protein
MKLIRYNSHYQQVLKHSDRKQEGKVDIINLKDRIEELTDQKNKRARSSKSIHYDQQVEQIFEIKA